ncbi:MAG TPA: NADP-dependent malic enzyme [Polyangiaceae bacterium]|nr:NADP-dependent malic enzyme [Polyangiaceae bacterium]
MADDPDALTYHSRWRPGKIEVVATKPLSTQRHLSLAYTPGVADACLAIQARPEDVYKYTAKGNLVAVVTNGTAVLGLGNIGPEAGKPVMEGKANLFKKFADIDVFDIELDAKTTDEIVAAVKAIAPTFGGINLEDIKSPECFEVERRLQEELNIPVFHDDQHGTAIISAAALINAVELTERKLETIQIVFSGAGAAAIACAELYIALGVQRENIVMFDVNGAVTTQRKDLFPALERLATSRPIKDITQALKGADALIGLSVGDVIKKEMLAGMAKSPIIFAMANPKPEIEYSVARKARPDAILATGRSDYPNQVNNVLGFPFIFRGALDCRASRITDEMNIAAAKALAALAREHVPDNVLHAYDLENLRFGPDYIIPKPFDARVLTRVAPAVAEAAAKSGVAREPIADLDAYRERLHRLVERARGLMWPLIQNCKAGSKRQRIVFPDGYSPQILRAARILVDEGICTPILLGSPKRIAEHAKEARVSTKGMEMEEVIGSPRAPDLAEALWQRRQRKGMTLQGALVYMRQGTWYGCMLVREGLADGMVGGLKRAYKSTIGPAIRVMGLAADSSVASGVYAMIFRDRKIFFGDCTVNIDPDAETLAEIAINTARVAETFGEKPRVAMLSYSDFGEHRDDPKVKTVRDAIEIVRQRWPGLQIDGEMQADTAVDAEKMEGVFPFCTLGGPANVLVFPDLTSGNIAYKLLERLTDTEALGPLVVGLGGPVSAIPVGATVNEIVNITTYTVVQAIRRRAATVGE